MVAHHDRILNHMNLVHYCMKSLWWVRPYTKTRLERDDLFQEARMALIIASYKYPGEDSDFVGYAISCIKNRLNSIARKPKLTEFTNCGLLDVPIDTMKPYQERKEDLLRITDAEINNIKSKRDRMIFWLRKEGLHITEIGPIVGLTHQMVSQILATRMKAMRQRYWRGLE